jgi:hypothetical protein
MTQPQMNTDRTQILEMGMRKLRGAHAPSRATFGASPNAPEFLKHEEFSVRAPKTTREARALPGRFFEPKTRVIAA